MEQETDLQMQIDGEVGGAFKAASFSKTIKRNHF
jgi:hypothetical protein